MKSLKKLIVFIVMCIIGVNYVDAAGSAYLSVSRSTIENGSSVTASVTVSNTAAWNVKINSSGSTSGCSQQFVGDSGTGENTSKTFSVTCYATSTGIINFTMSGDITSSDGTNSKLSDSKQVTVTNPRPKSTNNKLSSLSVEGYEISPKFDGNVNEYSVNVPSTVEKITINASKADSYASVSGTGEKEVEEGTNTFEIVVTSETGVSNTYTLTVNVEDMDPINVTVDGKKYTVVKVAKNLKKPELFDEKVIKIDGKDIPAFVNEVTKITLVGLKDEKGKISLFIYKDGEYEAYNEFHTDRLYVVFSEPKKVLKNFVKKTIKINEQDVVAYRVKDLSNYIVYGVNLSTGKENYYTYDSSERTLQKFDINKYEKKYKDDENIKYIVIGESGIILFLIILVMLVNSSSKKLKKYIKLEKNITENNEVAEEDKLEENNIEDKDNKKSKKDKNKEEVVYEEVEDNDDYVDDDFLDLNKKAKKKRKKNKKVKDEQIEEDTEETILDEEDDKKSKKK